MLTLIDLPQPETNVRRLLGLSTDHLSLEAQAWLNEHYTATGDYGWLCGFRDEDEEDVPASLRPIFKAAEAEHCTWLLFDSDAPSHPDLPLWADEHGQRAEAQGPIDEAEDA